MNKQFLALALAAALTGVAGLAVAQMNDSLKFHIPHPIRIAGSELAAGDYTIRPRDTGSAAAVWAVESANGETVLVAVRRCTTPGNKAAERTEMVFDESGGLAHIWVAGRADGYEVIQTHARKGAVQVR